MAKRIPLALMITDTHLSIDRDELVIDIFKQAIDICLKEKIYLLLHLGDWFNNRQGQPDHLLVTQKDIIQMVNDAGIHIYTFPGNHDKTNLDSWYSYISVFENEMFNVLDGKNGKFRKIIKTATSKELYIHFLPYFKSDKYIECLNLLRKDIAKGKQNILLTHIGVNGVRNNDGSKVDGNITQEMFKDFVTTFVGHYHDSSELPNNIRYIGSAYQANYGEQIGDKGFHILYDDCSTKFIPSKFPKYIKVRLNASDKVEIRNSLEMYSDKKYDKDYIRFVFYGKQTDIDKIKNDMSKFTDAGIEVKTESEEQEESINAIINDEFVEFNAKTIRKEFIQYCVINKVPSDKRKYMLEILNQNL